MKMMIKDKYMKVYRKLLCLNKKYKRALLEHDEQVEEVLQEEVAELNFSKKTKSPYRDMRKNIN